MERKYLQKNNMTANAKNQYQAERNTSPTEGTMIESKVVNRGGYSGYKYAFDSVSDYGNK